MPSTMIDPGASTSEEGFIPGLGRLGTRLYDPVVRLTTRERRFKERLLELADLRPGERALDLGCGTGTLAIAACRRQPGAGVHGLDADPRMIETARRKADAAGVGLELRQGVATELPYPDGSFDVVLSSLLFHHLDRAAKHTAAREVARVLVSGGRLVVADWGRASDPLMRVLFLTIQLVDGFETTRDNVHGRLPQILRNGGLTEVRESAGYRTVYGSLTLFEARAPIVALDAAEAMTRLGERRYAWPELCRLAGVDHDVADRLWRALGFPDVPADAHIYTADDVRALNLAAEGLDDLVAPEREAAVDVMLREARSIGAHLARIAEIEVDALGELARLGVRQAALHQARERGLEHSDLGWLLFYALRRRLDETLRRRATTEIGEHPVLAVGFVDLVGFTRASGRLDEAGLGHMLTRFEALAWDAVTEAGGRLVKLIGDEAMLVCPTAADAARAALEIVEASAGSDLPAARAGLAIGPLLPRGGDYFGAPVNLASRLVTRADPGTVVVDERFKAALTEGFVFEPLERRPLKGIGDSAAWRLRGKQVTRG
jgi:class 3 adenylate cyclase/SAM-dependent methyltransferase